MIGVRAQGKTTSVRKQATVRCDTKSRMLPFHSKCARELGNLNQRKGANGSSIAVFDWETSPDSLGFFFLFFCFFVIESLLPTQFTAH